MLCVVAVLRVFMTHDCRTNLPTGTDKVTWQIKWDQEGRSRRIIWFKVLKTYELDEPYSFRFRKACRPIWSPLRAQAANKTNEPQRTECSEQNIRDKRQRKVWNISGRVGNVSEAERNQLGVSLRNSNRYLNVLCLALSSKGQMVSLVAFKETKPFQRRFLFLKPVSDAVWWLWRCSGHQ